MSDNAVAQTRIAREMAANMAAILTKNRERKAIAIATVEGQPGEYDDVYALCNDGTIWVIPAKNDANSGDWLRLPDIPQRDELLWVLNDGDSVVMEYTTANKAAMRKEVAVLVAQLHESADEGEARPRFPNLTVTTFLANPTTKTRVETNRQPASEWLATTEDGDGQD